MDSSPPTTTESAKSIPDKMAVLTRITNGQFIQVRNGPAIERLICRIEEAGNVFGGEKLSLMSFQHINSYLTSESLSPIFQEIRPDLKSQNDIPIAYWPYFIEHGIHDHYRRILNLDGKYARVDKKWRRKALRMYGGVAVRSALCVRLIRDQRDLDYFVNRKLVACASEIVKRNEIVADFQNIHNPKNFAKLVSLINAVTSINQRLATLISPVIHQQLILIQRCSRLQYASSPCQPERIWSYIELCLSFVPEYLHVDLVTCHLQCCDIPQLHCDLQHFFASKCDTTFQPDRIVGPLVDIPKSREST